MEECSHVVDRVDRDANTPDLAEAARVVGVAPHLRREIERDREAGLTLPEQISVAFVRLRRRAEARILAHRPEPAAVHVRLHAAREGWGARDAEVADGVEARDVVGAVERGGVDPTGEVLHTRSG